MIRFIKTSCELLAGLLVLSAVAMAIGAIILAGMLAILIDGIVFRLRPADRRPLTKPPGNRPAAPAAPPRRMVFRGQEVRL